MRELIGGVPGQFVGAEPPHTGLLSNGRQASAKTKAVWKPGQFMRPLRKATTAVVLPKRELLPKRGRAHQHAIGFDPGPVDGLPAACSTGGTDLSEQSWAVAFHPGVKGRGGVSKM